jgi:hypothetical protein
MGKIRTNYPMRPHELRQKERLPGLPAQATLLRQAGLVPAKLAAG